MAKKKRRMAGTKEQVVLRLLRGEDMELVSRETGFQLHELGQWRERYMKAGREGLKTRPGDPGSVELQQAKMLIAQQALELEIVKKSRALTAGAIIPEPSTFALAALGLLGLGFFVRRRKR